MKENPLNQDTICSISTPPGPGGIGIIRISGSQALPLAQKIFVDSSGRALRKSRGYTIRYGKVIDPETRTVLDEVLLTVMRAPKTYTCEDVVEINCHSGVVVIRRIMELLLSLGARPAEPGEFTKRAFLNGRIDLAQAESVMSLVSAKNETALRVALQQLNGELSLCLQKVKESLIELLAETEVSIDFAEEENDPIDSVAFEGKINSLLKNLGSLIDTGREGKVIEEGLMTAIIGKANVGKSSLLNRLLKEDRAIVTPFPGTTRDVIESTVNIEGIPFCFLDTAGFRQSEDPVEREGIRRSREAIERADLILLLFDLSRRPDEEDREIVRLTRGKDVVLIFNKKDLVPDENRGNQFFGELIKEISPKIMIHTCLLHADGIKELKVRLKDLILEGKKAFSESVIVTQTRHLHALKEAREALMRVIRHLHEGMSEEFLSLDLREALDAVGRITGEVVTEDILDRIFSSFCVGK
ncbi:MAG: tRNA uridine-5-carboxymethylaminomethyl(34) synthesis GTPase MnmE [Deltaproteobacteria bacterium]|nr:tRNA uridine-5-carboxymethylaminomethyl(34) synthesis GTPase MnmE [Deltaproteobacteria bacterium]